MVFSLTSSLNTCTKQDKAAAEVDQEGAAQSQERIPHHLVQVFRRKAHEHVRENAG